MVFFMYTCTIPFWLSILAGKAALVWLAQLSVSNKNEVEVYNIVLLRYDMLAAQSDIHNVS